MSGAYANGILDALTDWLTSAALYAALMDQAHNQAANWKETDTDWDDVLVDMYTGTSAQPPDSVAVAIDSALDQVEITSAAEEFLAVTQNATDTVEYVVVFDNTPAANADKSLVCTDDGGTSGFGVTPNGSSITYTPDATNGIIYYDYGA